MSLTLAALRELVDCGLTAEQILRVAEAQGEAAPKSSGAERQRRYRQRQAEASQGDVTRDVTDDVTPPPSLPPEVSPHTPLPNPHSILPPSPPKGGSSPTPKDFDQFWSAYPAKVGKKAAQRAWRAAKDRPALPVVLAALDRYRRTKPADREWCNPATWINQGRWDDEEAAQPDAAAATLPAATFDGPPDLRAAVVREKDEDYARRWLDHYCRWRSDRTLLCRTDVVARTLSRDLATYLAEKRIRVEVDAANDASTPSHGAAA